MGTEIKPVSPVDAARLVQEGALYIDVRSEPEFLEGHAPDALNVPLMHKGPSGMTDNPEFLAVMQQAFDADAKLVIGCKAGPRSRRAATLLVQAGFKDVSDLLGGFDGGRDAFGRPLPGWRAEGLPVETGPAGGQTYADVKQRSK